VLAPGAQPGPNQVVVEVVGVNPVDAANRADPSWAGVRPRTSWAWS
jgi:NADPH:quinone reductase-like Zn-dependent oxidoreductase